MAGVHDIIHVSQLKKCLKELMDVVLPEVTPLEVDLTYPEYPIKILDQKYRITRHKTIKFFIVQWSNNSKDEATWESEEFLRSHHPGIWLLLREMCDCSLFLLGPFSFFKSRDEISFMGEGFATPSITIVAIVFYSTSTA
jgi:hypothetical protein